MQAGYKIEDNVYTRDTVLHILEGLVGGDESAESVMNRFDAERIAKRPSLYDITDAVCEVMGVDTSEIFNGRLFAPLPYTRHLISWFSYTYTKLTLESIRVLMGYETHVSVIHGAKTINGELSLYEDTRSVVDQIKGDLARNGFVLKAYPRVINNSYYRSTI